jgi:hypothetical protein
MSSSLLTIETPTSGHFQLNTLESERGGLGFLFLILAGLSLFAGRQTLFSRWRKTLESEVTLDIDCKLCRLLDTQFRFKLVGLSR